MRLSVATAVACLSLAGLSMADDVKAAVRRNVSIPPQELGAALQSLAREGGFQIAYSPDELGVTRTTGATGELTSEQALARLLKGTGFTYKVIGSNGVSILRVGVAGVESPTPAGKPDTAAEPSTSLEEGGQKSFWERFLLAQVDQGTTVNSAATDRTAAAQDHNAPVGLEEIVVTAQKRIERLQDVPVPVTAISGDVLVEQNVLQLRDYYTRIPGMTVTPRIQGEQDINLRGVTTGTGSPTVGISIDDVPYGSSTNTGGGQIVPDLDPGDLARVEVLRGPQGTLYGASSMGGLLKFVTRDPSTDGFSGRLQAGTSSVKNGDELGFNVRGSANVPLGERVAIRASAFTRNEPGYIDDPVRGAEGVNAAEVRGGRVSALWRASEMFSLKLSALLQRSKTEGSSDNDVSLGDLQQSRVVGTGRLDKKVQAYSAILTGKAGAVDLTLLSGYNVNTSQDSFDFSYAYGGIAESFFGVGGVPLLTHSRNEKITQEIRISMPLGSRVEWLMGAFYTDEESRLLQSVVAADTASGAYVGSLLDIDIPTEFGESAAFTNFTFHIVDRFDIQVGGRGSRIRQAFTTTYSGPLSDPNVPTLRTKDDSFTYLVTPQFKVSPDLMVYARLASGYRAGGPNAGLDVPPKYGPDETQNYEIGIKADFLERALSLDASLYYIDWKDIQLTVPGGSLLSYIANTSRATSRGVEISVKSRPFTGTAIAGWVAVNDATLSRDFPAGALYGLSGDRLPNSSRFAGNLSVDQDFPLAGDWSGFVGGTVSYVGNRLGNFRPAGAGGVPRPRQEYPSYTRVDLRAGARKAAWSVNVFVNNVTDERGVLFGGLGATPPTAFTYVQPRTVGLSLSKSF